MTLASIFDVMTITLLLIHHIVCRAFRVLDWSKVNKPPTSPSSRVSCITLCTTHIPGIELQSPNPAHASTQTEDTQQELERFPSPAPATTTRPWLIQTEENSSPLIAPLPDITGRVRGLTIQNTSHAHISFPNTTGQYHLEYELRMPTKQFHALDASTLDAIRKDQARFNQELLGSVGSDVQIFFSPDKPVRIRMRVDEEKLFDLRRQKFPDLQAKRPVVRQSAIVPPPPRCFCLTGRRAAPHHIARTDLGVFLFDRHKARILFIPDQHYSSYNDVPAHLLPRFHLGIHRFVGKCLQGASKLEYDISWSLGTWIRTHHLHIKIHFDLSIVKKLRSENKASFGHIDDLP